VAERQNAVITARQLQMCGFDTAAISRRVKAGRLFRKHQGVYAVGRADLSQAGLFHAAVLAIGDDATLSHRAAAALWGFWDRDIDRVEVTVPRRVASRHGIRIYQVPDLPRAERKTWWGVPVTTPARALLDLAATLTSDEDLARAVHEAEVQRRVTHASLRAEIDRNPRHSGCGRLAAEIADGPKPTRSCLEIRVLNILRRGDYPPFHTNARIPGLPRWVEVDFPAQRVVIEADGGRFHDTPYRRKRDARKQAVLEAAGIRVIRLRWDDVEPDTLQQTEARLGHALLQFR
jgi:hypothetical protein